MTAVQRSLFGLHGCLFFWFTVQRKNAILKNREKCLEVKTASVGGVIYMATGTSKKSQSKTHKSASAKKTSTRRNTAGRTAAKKREDSMIRREIWVLVLFAVSILLLISNFGIGGVVGDWVSKVMFGITGFFAYVLPVVLFLVTAFSISNKENTIAIIKIVAMVAAGILCCCILQLVTGELDGEATAKAFYTYSVENKMGGGFIGGMICKGLISAFGLVGTWIVLVLLMIICIVVITERSFIGGVKRGSQKVYDTAKEDAARYRQRVEEREARRQEQALERQKEEKEKRKVSRLEKKVSGVALNTMIQDETAVAGKEMDLFPEAVQEELNLEEQPAPKQSAKRMKMGEMREIVADGPLLKDLDEMFEIPGRRGTSAVKSQPVEEEIPSLEPELEPKTAEATSRAAARAEYTTPEENAAMRQAISAPAPVPSRPYVFPPINLLKQIRGKAGNSSRQLQETALHLQQILRDFGVGVTVTDVSCGPAVTRYELQPDQGVKVSRIVALSDDIKLNLAVADIRIEAPIPGKAAVGIEVPNTENATVSFRELITSEDFKDHKSNIAFAVGKDIGGKIMVADIAKMPHLLIAGATGSGKSVCINTLIMSILYKADPSDVKLIMVDPKVVELSVYNGIPHLLIPVVTDPKKAAAALNWAVAEMTDRYKKFAEYGVRNLQGYNEKIKEIEHIQDDTKPQKMPQIVIIVDELADLMMVASSEVEDAICRLAQLARAAGIHLIIATQRPSVNVITGLIKANMPSRIAFAVSSGVDSRTIIDMNGAEKLLGKGDMLFYPSGLPKPVRVQGAFVSDEEVSAVVNFLSKNNGQAVYSDAIEEHISHSAQPAAAEMAAAGAGGGDGRDVLFAEAGRFIIEKDKASIGMLQRWFKVGFNRAARIMDQLAEAGVVGEEAGTKPRDILMTMEEFEQYLEESM